MRRAGGGVQDVKASHSFLHLFYLYRIGHPVVVEGTHLGGIGPLSEMAEQSN